MAALGGPEVSVMQMHWRGWGGGVGRGVEQPHKCGATYQLVDAVDGSVVLVTQPLHAFKTEKEKRECVSGLQCAQLSQACKAGQSL